MVIQKTIPAKKVTIFKKKLPGCQLCRYGGFSTRCLFAEGENCPYDEAVKNIAKAGHSIGPSGNLK